MKKSNLNRRHFSRKSLKNEISTPSSRIKFLQEEQKIKQGTRKSFTKDVRLAINTVRQSVEMIKNNGLHVVVEESDEGEFVTFKIQIFKQK
jgi:ParB family chromosome partitioning protein